MSARCGVLLPYPPLLTIHCYGGHVACCVFLDSQLPEQLLSLLVERNSSPTWSSVPPRYCHPTHKSYPLSLPPSLSQLPRGDVEKLACLVFYYGGRMQQRLDSAVTHLITSDGNGVSQLPLVQDLYSPHGLFPLGQV